VEDIKPKLQGMKGKTVNFDKIEMAGSINGVKPKAATSNLKRKRVDLSTAVDASSTYIAPTEARNGEDLGDFIEFDAGDGQDYEALNYNHRLRRKLRRALEDVEMRKESLVREQVRKLCLENGVDVPPELNTPVRPVHKRGERVLENGTLETAKAERVRSRLELAEYNNASRVLRKQAKQIAVEAGLRLHAELTGLLPRRQSQGDGHKTEGYGIGWHVPKEQPPEDILQPKDLSIL